MTHEPVRTVADLATLDHDEIAEGYRDGLTGDPEPGGNRSRSYWHGWRNGARDAGHIGPDDAMDALAHAACPRGVESPAYRALRNERRRAGCVTH